MKNIRMPFVFNAWGIDKIVIIQLKPKKIFFRTNSFVIILWTLIVSNL